MSHEAIADVSTAVGSTEGVEPPDLVPALTIVSHASAHRAGERFVFERRELALSRNAPDFTAPGRNVGVPLDDPFVSRRPIRFVRGPDGVRVIVDPGGTPVIAGSPVDGSKTFAMADLVHGVPVELADRVVLLLHLIDRKVGDTADPLGMVGTSAGIRRVRTAIERIGDLTVPVLIRGETGTGKELVARAIHDRSPRRDGPFVSVNLGAISRELAPAELFGATRGAFTGALRDREGLFRTAHGGTLFLDELGEAAPEIQVLLLRVIEAGEFYPVGADRPIATHVRLIAATDANLEDQIQRGQFKAPLLHRLAGFELQLPPLRERREDIGLLFYHFAREELDAIGERHRLSPQDPYAPPWLPAQIAAQLVRCGWDGNIRHLRNVTRQLVIGSRGLPRARLDPHLADQLAVTPAGSGSLPVPPRADPGSDARRRPSEVTEAQLIDALRACSWDRKAAADRLRIPRPSIYDLIDRYPNIRTVGDLDADEITRCFQDCAGDLDAMVAQLQVSRHALVRRLRDLGLASRGRPGSRGDHE
ncbi:MAG TPA: sigma 54-interacting transcriptional regulator [Kofleriaceae bacterium]|jgi:two-component system nitrogen regulation response regulator GlnG